MFISLLNWLPLKWLNSQVEHKLNNKNHYGWIIYYNNINWQSAQGIRQIIQFQCYSAFFWKNNMFW